MRDVVFNGKFQSQTTTGVQRVAKRLVTATARLAHERGDGLRLSIAMPKDAPSYDPPEGMAVRQPGRLSGNAWEQLELPRIANRGLLVNLCNVGPLVRSGDIVMIHDAQAFLTPESYSVAFRTWYRTALPIMGRRAARVLTVSEYARQCLIRYGIAAAERISVIPNGVDHMADVRADRGILQRLGLEHVPYITAPASLQAHKNVRVLLEAMGRIPSLDIRLVLFGKDSRAMFLKAKLPLDHRVVFAGRVSDEEMRGLIEGSQAFAFPSTTEGFGLPPLEAMWLGVPAIVSTGGALPEVFGDAVLYCDPSAADSWATAIETLATDPARRAEWSGRARAHASQFTWARSAASLLQHIEGVIRL